MENGKLVLEVDDATFDREVLRADGPVLVDFGAAWCGPCRRLEPIVEQVAQERAGALKVVKVDIDASPEVARRYGVRAAPTLIVFRAGERTSQHVGLTNKEKVLALLDR